MDIYESIVRAARELVNAEALLITAGAGIGVDSGLPDFRGNEGFWKAYPPMARLGISFSEMANPEWFTKRPELAWGFYGHRLNLYRKTTPHQGFSKLLDIAENRPGGYFVFTSNVDGQFQKAGFREERVVECHGSIHYLQCTEVCTGVIWDGNGIDVDVDEETFEARRPLPGCINCGRLARPNILMFGDWSWIPDRTASQQRRLDIWLREIGEKRMRLVVIEIGAGTAVPTVRMNSERLARRFDGILIRINPGEYYVPPGHISVPLCSAEGINRIYEIAIEEAL